MGSDIFQAPKGTKDHLFESFYQRRQISEAMLAVIERYGFRQIQTPTFEYFEVLAKKAGPDVAGQIYHFQDKGGRELGLRAEHTASIARVIAAEGHRLPKPIKVAAYGNVYRYERPQSGRQREFTQINVETYGAAGPLADAEVIACFVDCYRAIGLTEFEIRISNRRLLETVLGFWGAKEIDQVIRTIDKYGKMPTEKWRTAMEQAGLDKQHLIDLEVILGLGGRLEDSGSELERLGLKDTVGEILAELAELEENLDGLGAAEHCRFDLSIARGLEYYTGVIFECIPTTVASFGSIGGGGRYDNLISLYGGPQTPAIGFAVGLERVMLLLEKLDKMPQAQPEPTGFLVAWYDPTCLPLARRLVAKLHAAGHKAQLPLTKQSFKKQFHLANQAGVRYVLVVGPDEVKNSQPVIKDLTAREERPIGLAEFDEWLRELKTD